MKCMRALVVGCVMGLAVLRPASAQIVSLHFLEQPAAELVKTAFAEPYGKTLAAAITALIKDSAAPSCTQPSGPQLAARVDAILQRRGTQILEILVRNVDQKRLREDVAANLGPGVFAEYEALKSNAVVREYIAMEAPARGAVTANTVADELNRFIVVHQIKLARRFPDSVTGTYPELTKADPTMDTGDKLDKFREQAKSPQLDRYFAIWLDVSGILSNVVKYGEAFQTLGPREIAAGFDADLAELCVRAP